MATAKTQEFKDFMISTREEIGPSVTNAPVWVMQKANKRIWNRHGKRHWTNVDMGMKFKRAQRKAAKNKK